MGRFRHWVGKSMKPLWHCEMESWKYPSNEKIQDLGLCNNHNNCRFINLFHNNQFHNKMSIIYLKNSITKSRKQNKCPQDMNLGYHYDNHDTWVNNSCTGFAILTALTGTIDKIWQVCTKSDNLHFSQVTVWKPGTKNCFLLWQLFYTYYQLWNANRFFNDYWV